MADSVKTYKIRWILDDSAALAAFKRGSAAMAALDRQAARTAGSIEKIFAHAGKAAEGATRATASAYQNGHSAAAAGSKRAADTMVADAKRVSAEKARVYTADEARAKANEQVIRATNKRLVADAVTSMKVQGAGGGRGGSVPAKASAAGKVPEPTIDVGYFKVAAATIKAQDKDPGGGGQD